MSVCNKKLFSVSLLTDFSGKAPWNTPPSHPQIYKSPIMTVTHIDSLTSEDQKQTSADLVLRNARHYRRIDPRYSIYL